MTSKLPPKPRTSPLVTRTIVAMSLGVPALGCTTPVVPSRIGPPPCDRSGAARAFVVTDEQSEKVRNVDVTLTIDGQTRVYKTDNWGEFQVQGVREVASGPSAVVLPDDGAQPPKQERATAVVTDYEVIRVDVRPGSCYESANITIRVRARQ